MTTLVGAPGVEPGFYLKTQIYSLLHSPMMLGAQIFNSIFKEQLAPVRCRDAKHRKTKNPEVHLGVRVLGWIRFGI